MVIPTVEEVIPGDPRITTSRKDAAAELLRLEATAFEDVTAEGGLPQLDRRAGNEVSGLHGFEASEQRNLEEIPDRLVDLVVGPLTPLQLEDMPRQTRIVALGDNHIDRAASQQRPFGDGDDG